GSMRVVSLLPSATEIVYALRLGDDLVAVTFECYDPAAARLEKAGIVRARVAAGQDLYTLDAGALAALDPELILTQDLCRVCAMPAGHVSQALDYLGCRAEVVSLDPHSLDEVLATI